MAIPTPSLLAPAAARRVLVVVEDGGLADLPCEARADGGQCARDGRALVSPPYHLALEKRARLAALVCPVNVRHGGAAATVAICKR